MCLRLQVTGFAEGLGGSGAALASSYWQLSSCRSCWSLPAPPPACWELPGALNHQQQLSLSRMEKRKKSRNCWPQALAVFCAPEELSCSQTELEAKGFGKIHGPEQVFLNISL